MNQKRSQSKRLNNNFGYASEKLISELENISSDIIIYSLSPNLHLETLWIDVYSRFKDVSFKKKNGKVFIERNGYKVTVFENKLKIPKSILQKTQIGKKIIEI